MATAPLLLCRGVSVLTGYELTSLGHSHLETLCHLKQWAEEHMSDGDKARASDRRANVE
jgi:DNA-binding HxlR family transcriptional regulator